MSTAFDQMTADLGKQMIADSMGQGQSLAVRNLPPNNTAPGAALVGIFDGKGGSAIIVVTAQGLVRLHLGIEAILNEGQS